MSHVYLTNKKGARLIVHREALKEAFPTGDGNGSICVITVKKKGDDGDTFTVVNEKTPEIEAQLKKLEVCKVCGSRPHEGEKPKNAKT